MKTISSRISIFMALTAGLFCQACSHTAPSSTANHAPKAGSVISKIRTTAYTHTERDHRRYGRKSAIGERLSCTDVKSAAADWSQFPVGTKFSIAQTGEVYCVDDYGSALVGTRTIDLYKPTRKQMNRWGVQTVDIQIMEWGSEAKSLEILRPRAKYPHVRQMLQELEKAG